MVSNSTAAEPLNAILEELRALSRKVDSHARMVEARFAEMHAKIDALETSLPKEVRVQLLPRKKQRLEFNPPACPNDTDGECEESHRNPPSAAPLVPHSHQHVAVEKKPLDAKPVPGENEELQEPHHNPPGVSSLLPHSHQPLPKRPVSVQSGISKSRKDKSGLVAKCTEPRPGQTRYWTEMEHERFLEAIAQYGEKAYVAISNYVETRTPKQVRTHAQKFQKKVARLARERAEAGEMMELPAGMLPSSIGIDPSKVSFTPPANATPMQVEAAARAASEKPSDTKPLPGENEECQETHHNPPRVSPLLPDSHHHNAVHKKTSDTKPVSGEKIQIKVRDAEGNEFQCKMKRSTALKKLKEAYCNRVGFPTYAYRFLFDGHRVQDDDTPGSLNMQELDCVDAMVIQVG